MAKHIVKILCFDPGLTKTGWSLIDYNTDTSNCTISKYGILQPNRITEHVAIKEDCAKYGKRLMALCELEAQVKDLIETLSPEYVACEDIFYNPKRPTAFIALSQWLTTVELLLKRYYMPLYKIPTKIAKKEIFGSGSADKINVQSAILSNGRIQFKTKPPKELCEHEADSIAVGLGFITSHLQNILLSKGNHQ